MNPTPGVKEWFMRHGQGFRHIALTAVPFFAAGESGKWVLTHFGQWIRTYHLVPSHRDRCKIPVYDRTKKEFLKWIRQVDCLVDDNEDAVERAESVGVKGILFPRPWNSQRGKPIEAILATLSTLQ